jgi:hypothetical protein
MVPGITGEIFCRGRVSDLDAAVESVEAVEAVALPIAPPQDPEERAAVSSSTPIVTAFFITDILRGADASEI